jgi:hypothetical protein
MTDEDKYADIVNMKPDDSREIHELALEVCSDCDHWLNGGECSKYKIECGGWRSAENCKGFAHKTKDNFSIGDRRMVKNER